MREKRKIEAFTLIELLVVIAVIAILAGMIVAASAHARVQSQINRAHGELSMLETALESYKAQRGAYPPDNAANPALPQLFYELTGTLLNGGNFTRIHGAETISQANVPTVFNVGGFVNSSTVSSLTDQTQIQSAEARDFITQLQPSEYYYYVTNGITNAVFGLPLPSPIEYSGFSPVGQKYVNQSALPANFTPIRYVSTNPTNNHDSYDLWVEMTIQGKLYRVSNWNPAYEVVQ